MFLVIYLFSSTDEWSFFTRPFHPLVFVILVCGLLITSFLWLGLNKLWRTLVKDTRRQDDDDDDDDDDDTSEDGPSLVLLTLFGTALGKCK